MQYLATIVVVPLLLVLLLEFSLGLLGFGYPADFLIRQELQGKPFYKDNPQFSLRFFAPELARPSAHLRIPAHKAPDTFRIFVLGGSAAMGDPDFSFSFSRILEQMLQQQYPDRRFEVHNAAITAINSNVVLPIARDCAAQQPDLMIVYLGNNEVIGPYGPGTVFAPFQSSLAFIRANVFLNTTAIGQTVKSLSRRWGGGGNSPAVWRGVDMFLENQIRPDDPRMAAVYHHFEQNLIDICRAGREAGAAVILATVATNLRDCPPFASPHPDNLDAGALQAWESHYRQGKELAIGGEWPAALAAFDQAGRIRATVADLAYLMGQGYAALGQGEEAQTGFKLARDLDALRFRADSRINSIIRRIATEEEGISLADAEAVLSAESPDGIPGEDLFLDHVHFNFHGNYRLAKSVLGQVGNLLPASGKTVLSEAECAARLAFTAVDDYRLRKEILGRMKSPAFANRLFNDRAITDWEKHLDSLQANLDSVQFSAAAATYRQAIKGNPQDWILHNNYGLLLLETGKNPAGALAEFRLVRGLFPEDHLTRNNLGLAFAALGNGDSARACYREALRLKPGFDKAHLNLGELYEREGDFHQAISQFQASGMPAQLLAGKHHRFGLRLQQNSRTEEAREQFEAALRLWPEFSQAHLDLASLYYRNRNYPAAILHYERALAGTAAIPEAENNLGLAYCQLGDFEASLPHFQRALAVRPDYPDARSNLAGALSRLGRSAEAIGHLQIALERHPEDSRLHNNLGGELLKTGQVKEAIGHFREALRLDPTSQSARRNLEVALGRLEGGE
ncbi:MAG: tetratricopeptide repeat protein [Calditrichaeota bacterium]|nr:tetratricopeptide repeat protein [Calditrichota bacterium]